MIRMTITKELEVTAEQVREELRAWANREGVCRFPFETGQYCRFTEQLATALKTHPDAPVLVIGQAEGCSIGTVAFVHENGSIQAMAAQPFQVRPLEDEPVAEPEPAGA